MEAGQRVACRNRRQELEGRDEKRHGGGESTLVQQVVGADGVTRDVIVAGRMVMPVVMCMPVVGLHGDGVLDVVKFTHGGQDGLQQSTQRHDQKQGVVQKTAVAANAVHGCV